MTANMEFPAEKYIKKLIDSLKKKYVLLRSILSLTQAQSSEINENAVEKLQKLIDEKQNTIDEINKLDDEFDACFTRLKNALKVNSLDELDAVGIEGAKHLKEITADIINLIKEISEIEKANNLKSEELLNNLRSEIKKINQTKTINNAYGSRPGNKAAYFIDKKK